MTVFLALTPFINSLLLSFFKWLTSFNAQTPGGATFLRIALALISIVGVMTANALSGQPLDLAHIDGLLQVAAEALVAWITSHGFYDLWSRARASSK